MTKTISLQEKIDAKTDSVLDAMLHEAMGDDTDDLILDAAETRYVSSAGLRVFLKYAKLMNKRGGSISFIHVRQSFFDVFEITGMSSLFQFEGDK